MMMEVDSRPVGLKIGTGWDLSKVLQNGDPLSVLSTVEKTTDKLQFSPTSQEEHDRLRLMQVYLEPISLLKSVMIP